MMHKTLGRWWSPDQWCDYKKALKETLRQTSAEGPDGYLADRDPGLPPGTIAHAEFEKYRSETPQQVRDAAARADAKLKEIGAVRTDRKPLLAPWWWWVAPSGAQKRRHRRTGASAGRPVNGDEWLVALIRRYADYRRLTLDEAACMIARMRTRDGSTILGITEEATRKRVRWALRKSN